MMMKSLEMEMAQCAFIGGPFDGDWNDVSDSLIGREIRATTESTEVVYQPKFYTWIEPTLTLLLPGETVSDFQSYKEVAEHGCAYISGQSDTNHLRAQLKFMLLKQGRSR